MSNFARYAELLNVDCNTCNSACCRENTVIGLYPQEAQLLREKGTELIPYASDEQPEVYEACQAVRSDYILGTDCAFLGENADGQSICTIFGKPNRPFICKDFPPACYACIIRREQFGVNEPHTIARFCDLEQSKY